MSEQSKYVFTLEGDRNLTAVFVPILPAGDVNGDGAVDVGDAILVLRHIVGLINLETDYGTDALLRVKVSDGGGDVDVGDAILLNRSNSSLPLGQSHAPCTKVWITH